MTSGQAFAGACGAAVPVELRIDRTDGARLAAGRLDAPFALVGRDPDCEIVLSDPSVSRRHALLQVVGGRVLLADIGSRTGVSGAAGGPGFVWLTTAAPAAVGPFLLHLTRPVSSAPAPLDRMADPFRACPALTARLPRAVIQFRNGKTARSAWVVNRLVTLVGRDPACKLRLDDPGVAGRHAYFALTPAGLWVVDLLSRAGVWVNGEPVRSARLADGDEVRVGHFRLGCNYPAGDPAADPVTPPTGFRPAGPVPGYDHPSNGPPTERHPRRAAVLE